MSRADVRAAVTQWVETPTIPNLNQVFTSFPKRIQFQQYAAPGQLNRAVAVVFIEMNQVGEDVGSIGEEQQPDRQQRQRQYEAIDLAQAEAEAERDGRQEEIPQHEVVVIMSGEMEAQVQHNAAPQAGKEIQQKDAGGHGWLNDTLQCAITASGGRFMKMNSRWVHGKFIRRTAATSSFKVCLDLGVLITILLKMSRLCRSCLFVAILTLATLTVAEDEKTPLQSKITQKGNNRTTVWSRGKERVMLSLESSTKGDGVYDRLIEAFYLNGNQVFTCSHFKPSPPGRMYLSNRGMEGPFIFSGSIGINFPEEVLFIGNPFVEQFECFAFENGRHRPMTLPEREQLKKRMSEFFPNQPAEK